MAIDHETESVFRLADGPSMVGKSYHTLYNYGTKGKEVGGVIVKLDVLALTSGLGTSVEAWHRFIAAINDP